MATALDTPQARIGARIQRLLAYRTLVKYLVLKDIKVKSRGTYLGVAWTLMNPLITIVVYYVVFRHVFRVQIPNYFSFFLAGFLLWVFFSRTVSASATCILESEGIVKRASFPLEVLPLSAMLYHLFHHAVALGIALPLMLALGGARVSVHLLWIVVLVPAFAVFTLAVGLWLSTLGVFFRDTRDILEVTLPVLFWITPIFYTLDMVPPALRPILAVNPIGGFIAALRTVLLEGQPPPAFHLVLVVGWIVLMLGSALWLFSRYGPVLAEEL